MSVWFEAHSFIVNSLSDFVVISKQVAVELLMAVRMTFTYTRKSIGPEYCPGVHPNMSGPCDYMHCSWYESWICLPSPTLLANNTNRLGVHQILELH